MQLFTLHTGEGVCMSGCRCACMYVPSESSGRRVSHTVPLEAVYSSSVPQDCLYVKRENWNLLLEPVDTAAAATWLPQSRENEREAKRLGRTSTGLHRPDAHAPHLGPPGPASTEQTAGQTGESEQQSFGFVEPFSKG